MACAARNGESEPDLSLTHPHERADGLRSQFVPVLNSGRQPFRISSLVYVPLPTFLPGIVR